MLRSRDHGIERPFPVPFYPVLPLLFCLTCAWMLQAAIDYAGVLSLVGLVPVLAGWPLYRWLGRGAPASG